MVDFVKGAIKFIKKRHLDIMLIVLAMLLLLVFVVLHNIDFSPNSDSERILKKQIVIEGLDVKGIDKDEKGDKEKNDLMKKVKGGFCAKYMGKTHELEPMCNELSDTHCKSSACCVLLKSGGGVDANANASSKCVAGDKHGPTYHNDDNGMDMNFDYYYYQNKCYGKGCT
jgi:hypothetical protein